MRIELQRTKLLVMGGGALMLMAGLLVCVRPPVSAQADGGIHFFTDGHTKWFAAGPVPLGPGDTASTGLLLSASPGASTKVLVLLRDRVALEKPYLSPSKAAPGTPYGVFFAVSVDSSGEVVFEDRDGPVILSHATEPEEVGILIVHYSKHSGLTPSKPLPDGETVVIGGLIVGTMRLSYAGSDRPEIIVPYIEQHR